MDISTTSHTEAARSEQVERRTQENLADARKYIIREEHIQRLTNMTEGYEAAWDLFTKAKGAAQRDKAHLDMRRARGVWDDGPRYEVRTELRKEIREERIPMGPFTGPAADKREAPKAAEEPKNTTEPQEVTEPKGSDEPQDRKEITELKAQANLVMERARGVSWLALYSSSVEGFQKADKILNMYQRRWLKIYAEIQSRRAELRGDVAQKAEYEASISLYSAEEALASGAARAEPMLWAP